MSLSNLIKPAQKFLADNTPVLLTGAGVVGAVASTVLTGKATIKAVHIVNQDYETRVEDHIKGEGNGQHLPDQHTKSEIVKLVWMEYLPAAGVLTATIVCVIFANRVSAKEAAALAAAYSISETKFSEYREKVKSSFGEGKERKVREDVVQDEMLKTPPPTTIIIGGGKVLCKDAYSNQYFENTVEGIRKAVNDFNQELLVEMDKSLTDFYYMIGVPKTGYSDEIGWTNAEPLDVDILSALTEDGKPCVVMDFAPTPRHKVDLY